MLSGVGLKFDREAVDSKKGLHGLILLHRVRSMQGDLEAGTFVPCSETIDMFLCGSRYSNLQSKILSLSGIQLLENWK